jgi:hypothetical protein
MTAVIRNNRANHWQWLDGRKRAFDTRQNPHAASVGVSPIDTAAMRAYQTVEPENAPEDPACVIVVLEVRHRRNVALVNAGRHLHFKSIRATPPPASGLARLSFRLDTKP